MKLRLQCRWLGLGLLGPALLLGCRHAPRPCDCGCSSLEATPSVVLSPDYRRQQAEPADDGQDTTLPAIAVSSANKPAAHAAAPPVTDSVVPAVHKTVEPPAGTVQVTAVAPASPDAASTTGTVELTAAEAEAMGIRPGYTPGALILPLKPHDPAAWPTLAKKTGSDEVRLVPTAVGPDAR